MYQNTFLFVGLLAAGATVLTISARNTLETRIIAAGFALVAWALWGLGASNVTVCSAGSGGGVTCHSASYPALSFIALIGLAAMFVFLAYHVLEAFGVDVDRVLGVRR